MTPQQLRKARATLGHKWGLGRELRMSELGRVLRFPSGDPGQSIRDYERGLTRIPGPVSLAVELLLEVPQPPGGVAAIRKDEA